MRGHDVDGVPETCLVSVVRSVAEREGADPAALPPLYDAVGPSLADVLDDRSPQWDRLEFSYHGYAVVVDGDGRVELSERLDAHPTDDAREYQV